jgi:hypothetical protein
MESIFCFRSETILAGASAARDGTRVPESSKRCTCTDEHQIESTSPFFEVTENNEFAP